MKNKKEPPKYIYSLHTRLTFENYDKLQKYSEKSKESIVSLINKAIEKLKLK